MLATKYIKPRATALIAQLNTEWNDTTALELGEVLADYFEAMTATAIPLTANRHPVATPVVTPTADEEVEQEPRKPRRKGYKKVDPTVRIGQNQALVATLVARGNDGVKMIRIDPDDLNTDMAGLLKCVAQFNASKWRDANCPNSRLYYKPSLKHVECRMVRTDI